jgi:uncharacterized protein (TIGR02270 family)
MTRDPNVARPIGFKPWEISALINQTVLDQHAEEAAFLWTQRDRAVLAPQYSLMDLATLDERVEAHVDGLRAAGDAGWNTASQAIEMGPGEAFTAGILAFESGDSARRTQVIDVGCVEPAAGRALISAIGWMSPKSAADIGEELLVCESHAARRIAIGGLAVHRVDSGSHLIAAISSPDPALRSRALRAIAELGRRDLLGAVILELTDTDDDCRFAGAWCAARLGESTNQVLAILHEFAGKGGSHSIAATEMALRCLPLDAAHLWRRSFLDNPVTARVATVGAGALGDPACMDELLLSLHNPSLARVAGEAFSMITGVDLGLEDLDADAPETFAPVPNDDAADEEIGPDPDEDLQWPSPERVAEWWLRNRDRFTAGVRYLAGQPISHSSLADTLVNGTQRQRAAAALELALRNPSEPLFEVRERGNRQLQKVKRWIS